MERPLWLPVWPVWNGLLFILLDVFKQRALAAALEDWLGGRVAPMQLDSAAADPFILLVHHRHSFQKFDPLRAISRAIIDEVWMRKGTSQCAACTGVSVYYYQVVGK